MTSKQDSQSKVWVVGPCSAESRQLYLETGQRLSQIMGSRDWYYKASFDKANRTAIHGKRGPGPETLEWFKEIKELVPSIRLTTDVHETHQVEELVGIVDVIQIPAFLCRQTDLLVECGKHFDKVNVKKGQWIDPSGAVHIYDKVKNANPDAEVWLTERGTAFGYGNLIVDFGASAIYAKHFDRVILDCTHSTQRKKGDFTGGDRKLAEKYMLASLAFEYNGIFAETHPNPPEAISDGDCQIFLDRMPRVLERYDQCSQLFQPEARQ